MEFNELFSQATKEKNKLLYAQMNEYVEKTKKIAEFGKNNIHEFQKNELYLQISSFIREINDSMKF